MANIATVGAMLNPAAHIIEKLGGVALTAELSGRSENRVYRWGKTREKGGTGGLIPADVQQELMQQSDAKNLGLTPADFFIGIASDDSPNVDAPANLDASTEGAV